MRSGLVVLVVLLVAGCSEAPETVTTPPTVSPPQPAIARLPTPQVELLGPGRVEPLRADEPPVETWTFDPSPWGEGEAYVALHPTDPQIAAVSFQAWRDEGESGWRVFCIVTTDGGASWRTWNATPIAPVLPAGPDDEHQFDASVAFGKDGALHVAYGDSARGPLETPLDFKVVVATSRDLGETWDVRPLPSPGPGIAWDYLNVAAARDSEDVYVVANVIGAGPWFWRSGDAGETWSNPLPLLPSVGVPARPLYSIPHVAAGRDGLVVVTMRASGTFLATASADAGATFSGWRPVLAGDDVGGSVGRGLVVRGGAEEPIEFYAAFGERIVRAFSSDAAATFGDAQEVATAPAPIRWVTSAAGAQDRTVVLTTFASGDADAWGAALDLVEDGMASRRLLLAPLGDARAPRGGAAGDDYGGVAVAADGAVWAAWSDPRGNDTPRVSVARWFPTG